LDVGRRPCGAAGSVEGIDKRHIIFFAGLIVLAVMAGYVRDLGKSAGVSLSTIQLLEKLAIFA
jgi:hypothetical protein